MYLTVLDDDLVVGGVAPEEELLEVEARIWT